MKHTDWLDNWFYCSWALDNWAFTYWPRSSLFWGSPLLSCALLCCPVLSCALVCSPVLSCALLRSPVLSRALSCSLVLSCAFTCPNCGFGRLSRKCLWYKRKINLEQFSGQAKVIYTTTNTIQHASQAHLTGSSDKLPLATQLQKQCNLLATFIWLEALTNYLLLHNCSHSATC
jgi:hypothetical protein